MRLFKFNQNKAAQKSRSENREIFLAIGSSRQQLETIREIVESINLSDNERRYFSAEVFPMLYGNFEAACYGRDRFFIMEITNFSLAFAITIISSVSATTIVPDIFKLYPSLAVAIIGAIITLLTALKIMRQPALDWMAARVAYDEVMAEVINRVSVADIYASLPDDNSRFLEMVDRINRSNYTAESKIQGQIRSFQQTLGGDGCAAQSSSDK